jgi:undecaprenyl-diphosphatase
MALGFERKFAVRYSFLLSLPAVLGATLLEVVDVVKDGSGVPDGMLGKYLLGMVIAGVVGYFAIKLVNLLATKGKFGAFAYYCWAVGALSLVGYFLGFRFVAAA